MLAQSEKMFKKTKKDLLLSNQIEYTNCTRPRSILVILGYHKDCVSCRITLRRKKEGKEVALPPLFDLKSIQGRPETRGTMCYYLICQIGRSKLQEKHPLEEQTTIEKEPSVRCSTWLSPLGKGLLHQYSQIKYGKTFNL